MYTMKWLGNEDEENKSGDAIIGTGSKVSTIRMNDFKDFMKLSNAVRRIADTYEEKLKDVNDSIKRLAEDVAKIEENFHEC